MGVRFRYLGAVRRPEPHPVPERAPSEWSAARVRAFRRSLLRFFEARKRDLPWRRTRDPYAVLVSEVMLQQTRVETVIPYFRDWMVRFPTPQALAEAESDEVLRAWEGMGYYARARNLHQAVQEVAARYGGTIPDDPEELETLPGVGAYTAGAVASIAFGVAAPAVDGNVRRVLSRLADDPGPSVGQLRLWAARLVDPSEPGAFNQGLMELGSLICTPRAPDCEGCPVARFCASREAGTQEERPRPRERRPVPTVWEAVAILLDRPTRRRTPGTARQWRVDGLTSVLVRKRLGRGLLAGMWELPGREVSSKGRASAEVVDLAKELLVRLGRNPGGVISEDVTALPPLDHAFSHRRMRYLPFLLCLGRSTEREGRPLGAVKGGAVKDGGQELVELRWVGQEEAQDLPLPVAQRKLLDQLWDQRAAEGSAQMGQIAISGSRP
ncbi:MAG: A/G-specific adenine glycosylase [Gemmatimonadetes bacterium]|nr:A/G-specific adenine glycosylase [Gemmatimonadota bacterium]